MLRSLVLKRKKSSEVVRIDIVYLYCMHELKDVYYDCEVKRHVSLMMHIFVYLATCTVHCEQRDIFLIHL
jgi:hypothetical protein